MPDELTDGAVYRYYPPLKKVREWIAQAGFVVEEEGAGSGSLKETIMAHCKTRPTQRALDWRVRTAFSSVFVGSSQFR